MTKIPKSLQNWFLIHFVLDIIFAVPLLFFPEWFLGLFGFINLETLTARLVGAALIGVGGTSALMHKGSKEVYQTMLSLKLLWSSSACLGILLAIFSGSPPASWLFFGIFAAFFVLWAYYKKTL